MLQIVEGDIDSIKTEMKRAAESTKNEIRELKKRIRELRKKSKDVDHIDDYIAVLDKKITALNEKLKFYRPSRILPVEVDGIIINYKIYQKYVKSLRNLHFEEFMNKSKFTIKHENGCLELYDISKYFLDFNAIPIGRRERS